MENRTKVSGAPPRMMNAIIAGFNVAANNLALLVLPAAIDLLLWLGPQIRIKQALLPLFTETSLYLQQANSSDLAARIRGAGEIWNQILDSFNLLGLVRTIPIGVPSLMASAGAGDTPLGAAWIIEVNNLGNAVIIWLAVLAIGQIAGSLYFHLLAQATAETKDALEIGAFIKKIGQAFGLSLSFFILLAILAIPALLLVSVVALINPMLGDFAMMFAGFLLIWILFPLVFTPHAVFSGKNNLVVSIMTSVRLVRYFLPGTGIFIIVGMVFTQGMDILWRVPPTSSWMTLVGILGHAFIYTAIFAASFVYFRGGLRWMVESTMPARQQEINT
ncbi:MAG: hypothetical protein ACYDGL_03065 [Bellilinea sp.]